MDPKRRQQNEGNRPRGWDGTAARPDERAPYDPTKEKVMAEVGRISLDRNGKLKPELADQLARLLVRGSEMIRSGIPRADGAFSVEPK